MGELEGGGRGRGREGARQPVRNHGLSEPCLSKLQESRKLMLFDVLTMMEGAASVCSCAVL